MFDFTRYNYLEGRGWAEFNKPAYEKRLWDDDGSWFEAPTIRGIVDIGMSIVGAIVVPGFGAALFGLVDDLVFTVADVSGGYKSATDAFGAFAKKAAVAVATSLVGDLGIGDAVTGALGGSGIETGLLNIIAGTSGKIYDSFTDEEKTIAQTLMTSAGMSMNATGYWTECGRDQKLDMYSYMNAAGTHVPDVLFNTYYNNTVDSLLAQTWGVDLGFENNNAIPETLAEKYSALISQHLQQTSTPTSLKDKYKFTVFGKDEVGTDLFKIDENNPFLDQLLGQHDFAGINNVIDNSGCNFMAILAIPQLLTGSIFNQTQILDIWKQAIGVNGGVYGNADIYNPEKLTDLVFKYMNNTNLSLSVGYDRYKEKEWPLQMVAYRIRVPADPYHFTLGSLNNNIIYNPGWTTGEQKIRPIYLKRK